MMTLYDDLLAALPELTNEDFHPITGTIELRNDSDGLGDYIKTWNYEKPIPAGLKLGKD
jgi:hypothetical protein